MATSGPTEENERFDMASWATDFGYVDAPSRASVLSEIFGVSSDHMRKLLKGTKNPSDIIKNLAAALERIADLEQQIENRPEK